jgi:hypothetical protein
MGQRFTCRTKEDNVMDSKNKDKKEELVVIRIHLPRPMTFQEAFGFDPKDCKIDWKSAKRLW